MATGRPGTMAAATAPTATDDSSTSPTASAKIGCRNFLKSM
jgi:hypothetical protein